MRKSEKMEKITENGRNSDKMKENVDKTGESD